MSRVSKKQPPRVPVVCNALDTQDLSEHTAEKLMQLLTNLPVISLGDNGFS